MTKNKKKSKKKIIMGITLIAVLILVVAVPILVKNKGNVYSEQTVKKDNIETYYAFSGNVESKNIQNLMAKKVMQISDIKVSEGKKVDKDTVLFETAQGDKIKSKISGTVTKIYINEDQTVMSGTKLCDIIDLENLKVTLKVDEYDISSISKDKKVEITMGAIDKKVSGTVDKVSETAMLQNGVAYFTASVDLQKDDKVKVGMTAEARILNKSGKNVLTVPIKALQFDESDKPYVNIKSDKDTISKQLVKIGINDGKKVEIIEGLSEGQTILVEDTTKSSKNSATTKVMPPMPGK